MIDHEISTLLLRLNLQFIQCLGNTMFKGLAVFRQTFTEENSSDETIETPHDNHELVLDDPRLDLFRKFPHCDEYRLGFDEGWDLIAEVGDIEIVDVFAHLRFHEFWMALRLSFENGRHDVGAMLAAFELQARHHLD